ncbi:YIP1 family protein [Methanosarcina mazei]|uniref:YIP1 family protein n=1 Tax=Methanosarcina mazei TaxID=2209 RepID=UPI003C78FD5E
MDNLNLNNLLFDPNSFFEEKSRNDVDLKYPVLILLVVAVIAMVSSFLAMNQLRGLLPSEMSSYISTTAILFGVIWGLIWVFLIWVIVAGIVTIQVEPLKGYNFSSFRGKIAYKLNPISFRYYAYT